MEAASSRGNQRVAIIKLKDVKKRPSKRVKRDLVSNHQLKDHGRSRVANCQSQSLNATPHTLNPIPKTQPP